MPQAIAILICLLGVPERAWTEDGPGTDEGRGGGLRVAPQAPGVPPPPHDTPKNRYISFVPNNPGAVVAFQVLLPDGRTAWVGEPEVLDFQGADAASVSLAVDGPVSRLWTEPVVHVTGCVIQPGSPSHLYQIRADDRVGGLSGWLYLPTANATVNGSWPDIVGTFSGGAWTGPNGFINFPDMDAFLRAFVGQVPAPHMTWVDVGRQWPSYALNIDDFRYVWEGFLGSAAYPPVNWEFQTLADCPLDPNGFCLVDADCQDHRFCNGVETCNTSTNECEPATTDPTPGRGCDELNDRDVDPAGLIEWIPVDFTGGPFVLNGNEIIIAGASLPGEVRLDLFVSQWDPLFANGTELGGLQATLDSSTLLGASATPPNPGVDLSPVGWPADPHLGAYIITKRCLLGSLDGEPCDSGPHITTADCVAAGGILCVPHPDYVLDSTGSYTADVRRVTTDFIWWGVGPPGSSGVIANFARHYAGTLVLEVPAGAVGAYSIGFRVADYLDEADYTMLRDPDLDPIGRADGAGTLRTARGPGLSVTSALITIVTANPPLPEDGGYGACVVNSDCPGQATCIDSVCYVPKNRYISFIPNNGNTPVAFEVTWPGSTRWVGAPVLRDNLGTDFQWIAPLVASPVGQTRDWSPYLVPATGENLVHISGTEIDPNITYEIRAVDSIGFPTNPLLLDTTPYPTVSGSWADCVGTFDALTNRWLPPDDVTNFNDIAAVINAFGLLNVVPVTWVDLGGSDPNYLINFSDVADVIAGFKGDPYPY